MSKLLFVILCFPIFTIASENSLKDTGFFSLDVQKPGKKASNIFWLPLGSYFAPGLAQYIYGQYGAGATYTTIGAVGLATVFRSAAELSVGESAVGLDSRDNTVRAFLWGAKTYDFAGSLSLYHAFRTAVKGRQRDGDYKFLGESETTDELMLAPFQFAYLGRWTTIVPLGLLVAGVSLALANDDYHSRSPTGGDYLFSAGISYNAGVGEEALFRGWLQPILTDSLGSPFWGNILSSTIFAAAHISSDNPVPWPQFMVGYYLGWLAQKNGWSLSESIFIHTWWDIIAFTASYSQGNPKASIYVPIYQTQF